MTPLHRRTACLLASFAYLISAALASLQGRAQNKPPAPSPEHALIQQMVGTWDVRASIWMGPDAKPMVQSAVARRRLIGDALLEEVMTQTPGSENSAFTRVAFLNYNVVTGSYEYMSWDTRAPQMMYQVSRTIGTPGERPASGVIWFYLVDHFVVPQWGDAKNVAFRGRLMLEPGRERQAVRLYWTRLSGEPNKEFLAGEYIYTRKE